MTTRSVPVIVLAHRFKPKDVNAALAHAATHEIVGFVERATDFVELDARFGAHPRVMLVPLAIGDVRARRLVDELSGAAEVRSLPGATKQLAAVGLRTVPIEGPGPRFIVATGASSGYRSWLSSFVRSVAQLDYPLEIYDLGGLGFGVPLRQPELDARDFYEVVGNQWKSKALHKPALVEDCLRRHATFTIYLDADTLLLHPIDEVVGDYDVGVTIRSRKELLQLEKSSFEYSGYVNAGVVFFGATRGARAFVKRWKALTRMHGNDQKALNLLVNPSAEPLAPGRSFEGEGGVRIRTFPGLLYNKSCTLPQELDAATKIAHFKSNVRSRIELPAELARRPALWAPPIQNKLEMCARLAGIEVPAVDRELAASYDSLAKASASRWSHMYYWERAKVHVLEEEVARLRSARGARAWSGKALRGLSDGYSSTMKKRAAFIALVESVGGGAGRDEAGRGATSPSDMFDRCYWECEAMGVRRGARVFDLDAGSGAVLWCLREIWECDVAGMSPDATSAHARSWKTFGLTKAIRKRAIAPSKAIGLLRDYDCIFSVGVEFAGADWNVAEYMFMLKDAARHLRKRGALHLRFAELPPAPVLQLFRRLFGWSPTPVDTLLRLGPDIAVD